MAASDNRFKGTLTIHKTDTSQNTIVSPNLLVWKFCGKAQFPQSFGKLGEITIFYAV